MTEPTRLIVRGYLGDAKIFEEEPVTIAPDDLSDAIVDLARKHAAMTIAGIVDMVELELPDEPDPEARFHRIGVNPRRMVRPLRIDL